MWLYNRDTKLIMLALTVLFWSQWLGSVFAALGMIVTLMIHEMGHYLAFQHRGMASTFPVITPIGGLVSPLQAWRDAEEEAFTAIAGPALGTVGGLFAMILAVYMDVPLMKQVAVLTFALNLFNLIPLAPMDGGRISMVITRHLWLVGAPMFAYFMFSIGALSSGFNLILVAFIAWQAFMDVKQRAWLARENPGYFQVGFGVKVGYTAAYLALAGFLYWAVTDYRQLEALLIHLGL